MIKKYSLLFLILFVLGGVQNNVCFGMESDDRENTLEACLGDPRQITPKRSKRLTPKPTPRKEEANFRGDFLDTRIAAFLVNARSLDFSLVDECENKITDGSQFTNLVKSILLFGNVESLEYLFVKTYFVFDQKSKFFKKITTVKKPKKKYTNKIESFLDYVWFDLPKEEGFTEEYAIWGRLINEVKDFYNVFDWDTSSGNVIQAFLRQEGVKDKLFSFVCREIENISNDIQAKNIVEKIFMMLIQNTLVECARNGVLNKDDVTRFEAIIRVIMGRNERELYGVIQKAIEALGVGREAAPKDCISPSQRRHYYRGLVSRILQMIKKGIVPCREASVVLLHCLEDLDLFVRIRSCFFEMFADARFAKDDATFISVRDDFLQMMILDGEHIVGPQGAIAGGHAFPDFYKKVVDGHDEYHFTRKARDGSDFDNVFYNKSERVRLREILEDRKIINNRDPLFLRQDLRITAIVPKFENVINGLTIVNYYAMLTTFRDDAFFSDTGEAVSSFYEKVSTCFPKNLCGDEESETKGLFQAISLASKNIIWQSNWEKSPGKEAIEKADEKAKAIGFFEHNGHKVYIFMWLSKIKDDIVILESVYPIFICIDLDEESLDEALGRQLNDLGKTCAFKKLLSRYCRSIEQASFGDGEMQARIINDGMAILLARDSHKLDDEIEKLKRFS